MNSILPATGCTIDASVACSRTITTRKEELDMISETTSGAEAIASSGGSAAVRGVAKLKLEVREFA